MVREVTPEVYGPIHRPALNWDEIRRYLRDVGGESWADKRDTGESGNQQISGAGDTLVEFNGRLCFDPETEILTRRGWVPGLKLDADDEVLTWNRREHRSEFQAMTYVEYDYEGPMLAFKQLNLDLLVTPDHRMWVSKMNVGGVFGPWHFATAETVADHGAWRMSSVGTSVVGDIPPTHIEIPPHTYRSGRGHLTVRTVPGRRLPIEPYLRLLGYAIAEGFSSEPSNGAGAYVSLCQSKGPVLDRMIQTAQELGLSHHIQPDPRKPEVCALVIGGGRQFVRRFTEDLGSEGSLAKRIPRWVLNLDARWLKIVYQAMCEGDGTMAGKAQAYCTSSVGLADDVQELLVRLGKVASIRGDGQLRVRELEKVNSISRAKDRRWVPYSGKVWCVSTANGIVYVRRNKITVWSGNCYRSWEPGLNANVTKIREDQEQYLGNVMSGGHGSVLEHANYGFLCHNVSRVFTHEIARHRAGVAISQESMRFVRLTDIPFWFPDWVKDPSVRVGYDPVVFSGWHPDKHTNEAWEQGPTLLEAGQHVLEVLERFQQLMSDAFGLDETKDCVKCAGTGRMIIPDTGHYVARRDESGDHITPITPEQFDRLSAPDESVEDILSDDKCRTCNGAGQVSLLPFAEKKAKTSYMRRFAPDGVATGISLTFNIRAIRHIVYMRTALGAEEEIRIVCDRIAEIMLEECPGLMQDFNPNEDREWIPEWIKT